MGPLIVIVAMFVLLWLLFIRPQRARMQAQQKLVSNVSVGDEILTAGGIYGTVLELHGEDELLLEIAPGTRVRVARRAVAAVMPDEDEIGDEPDAADEPLSIEEAAAEPDELASEPPERGTISEPEADVRS